MKPPPGVVVFVQAVVECARRTGRASGFCKFNKVLACVAAVDPDVPADWETWLFDEQVEWSEESDEWYDRFVALVVAGEFVEGQGNFGDEDCAPAHPKFLECRVTAKGLTVLADAGGPPSGGDAG